MNVSLFLVDCRTQGSSRRRPSLEAAASLAWLLHYNIECVPGVHAEEDPGPTLPCEVEASYFLGLYGIESCRWACEAESDKWLCSRIGGHPHLDHERYCCRFTEYRLIFMSLLVLLFVLSERVLTGFVSRRFRFYLNNTLHIYDQVDVLDAQALVGCWSSWISHLIYLLLFIFPASRKTYYALPLEVFLYFIFIFFF